MIQHSTLLTISQGVNLLFSLTLTLILASELPVSEFGAYTLYLMIVMIVSIFIDFGLNESSAQDLAEMDDLENIREHIGNIYFISVFICTLFMVLMFLLSLVVDSIFAVKAGLLLQKTWWLLFFVPLYELTKSICRGCGYMWQWALINMLPRFIFLIFLGTLKLYNTFSLENAIVAFALAYAVSTLPSLFILRPTFLIKRQRIEHVINKVRVFGLNVMIGSTIFNVTTFFDRLFISLLLNSNMLAVYQMSVTLASPITMFSRSIGISTFRQYTGRGGISERITRINLLFLCIQALAVFIIAPYILKSFAMEQYAAALVILPYVLIAHIFLGLKQPYAFYLIARQQGAAIRKISILTAILSLLAYMLLISSFSLYGAVGGLIITYLFLFIANMYQVKKTQHEQE